MALFNFLNRKKEKTLNTTHRLLSPLAGTIIPLEQVSDPAFSSGALGEGLAIKPEEGVLYAPVSGTVTFAFPTGHAIGILSDDGVEVLLHVGIDTVDLKGKGFEVFVKQDDQVQVGDLLIKFDIPFIEASGYSIETPLVITNSEQFKEINSNKNNKIQVGEEILIIK